MAKGDFTLPTKRDLRKRAGEKCAKCNRTTSFSKEGEEGSTSIGEAAHIKGKNDAPNLRFDESLNHAEVAHISNGIWLCRTCHKEIDSDENRFAVKVLLELKKEHEKRVRNGYFDNLNPSFHDEKKIEHDRKVFEESEKFFNEELLESFLWRIEFFGYVNYHDEEYEALEEVFRFHKKTSKQYMHEELINQLEGFEFSVSLLYSFLLESEKNAESILYFPLGSNFLSFGLEKPSIVDIATNPSVISFYDRFKRSLDDHLEKVEEAYIEYRRVIKEKLYV